MTEGGDGSGRPDEESPVSVFTNSQVLDIRKRRFKGERKKTYTKIIPILLLVLLNVFG